jgi:hypothetical protein
MSGDDDVPSRVGPRALFAEVCVTQPDPKSMLEHPRVRISRICI